MAIRKPLPMKAPPPPLERWNVLGLGELAEPLPPVPWVCEPIGLAPGAVSLVAGYGYSRKTMALQSLGLSVAAGKSVWGVWSCRKGNFVHLDYEQGRRLTQERYQRLAKGQGYDLRDLSEGALRVACMPRAYLDEDGVFDELVALVGDATLVLVDSLRAAFPRADENSSEVRTYLDVLSRVSERTGAAIVVIHHARKPNATNGGTATHAIRGSSALFDACQSVYVFEGEKDTPTRVHHQKDRVRGLTLAEFGLTSEDVPGPQGSRDGLVVRHLELEQMVDSAEEQDRAREEAAVLKTAKRILEIVGPGGFRGSRLDVRAQVRTSGKVSTRLFDAAWSRMMVEGFLTRSGSNAEPVWTISEGTPIPDPPSIPHPSPDPRRDRSPIPRPLRDGDRSMASGDDDRSSEHGGGIYGD